jgi:hypothetical protein
MVRRASRAATRRHARTRASAPLTGRYPVLRARLWRSTMAQMAEAEAEEAPLVPTLNKSDLVSRIATRTGVTKKVRRRLGRAARPH